MCAGACRGRKRALDTLELELRAVVSHTMWVLRLKHGSSARTGHTLKSEPSLQPKCPLSVEKSPMFQD